MKKSCKKRFVFSFASCFMLHWPLLLINLGTRVCWLCRSCGALSRDLTQVKSEKSKKPKNTFNPGDEGMCPLAGSEFLPCSAFLWLFKFKTAKSMSNTTTFHISLQILDFSSLGNLYVCAVSWSDWILWPSSIANIDCLSLQGHLISTKLFAPLV